MRITYKLVNLIWAGQVSCDTLVLFIIPTIRDYGLQLSCNGVFSYLESGKDPSTGLGFQAPPLQRSLLRCIDKEVISELLAKMRHFHHAAPAYTAEPIRLQRLASQGSRVVFRGVCQVLLSLSPWSL